ncbi:MAG: right-handed parallel beta-helix repeat-containing protein [Polyangiales bacterium]
MRSASLLVAVALSMYAAPSFATDLWVAPTGRSGNAGTMAAPLDTIVTALQRARPGDRVMVRAGTYRGGGWISAQGTEARPITVLSADGPRRAVINGGSESLRIGDEARYLVFDGLEVRGADNNVIHIDGGSHHIWLRNVFAHDAGQDGDVVKVNQSSSIYIESSEIARPGRRNSSENPYQECIDFVDVDDIVVRDSWIHDGGGSLMYAKGGSRGVVFERNLISGQRDGAADPMVGLGGVTDSDILGGERFEAYDLIFRNNILLGGAAGGVAVYDASNASIANNLFVNVDGSAIVQFRPGSGPAARSENVRAVNNIFLDTRGDMPDPFRRSGGHGVNAFTTSHNLFWNNGARVPAASLITLASQPGHLVADPMIAVADETDRATLVRAMTPAENSPAFDSGIAVSASPFFVVDDIRGVNRGAHNDRGPWAIGVEAPTAPTPDGDAGAPTDPTPSQDAGAPTRADAGTPTVTDGGAPAADDPPRPTTRPPTARSGWVTTGAFAAA